MKVIDRQKAITPVDCLTHLDIRRLAKEMQTVCLNDVDHIENYEASKTELGARFKAEMMQEDMLESGHLRLIRYAIDGRLVTVMFTMLEKQDKTREWHLSLSHPPKPFGGTSPERVDDDLANLIADCFLGEYKETGEYQEVAPKAVWKTVRHFIREVK